MRNKHSDKARKEKRVRNQRQARGIANEQGAGWFTGGRHAKVKKNGRSVPVPTHGNKDYPIGTGRSIFKMMVSAGILFIIFAFVFMSTYAELMAG